MDESMISDKTYQVYQTAKTAQTTYRNTTNYSNTATYSKPVKSSYSNATLYSKPTAYAANNQPSYGNNQPAPQSQPQPYAQTNPTYDDNQYMLNNNQYGQPGQYDRQTNAQSYDYKSDSYQQLSRQKKMNLLWQKIVENDTPASIPSYEEFEQIMVQDPSITLKYDSDVMPKDRKKRIHKQGVVQQVRFIAEKNSPYTGLFQGGADNCIIRYSLASAVDFKYIDKASASEAYNQFSPSIALKCLVDGKASANIFGMYAFNGQSSWNWFKNNLYNHLPDPYGLTIDMIHKKFSTATPYTQILGTTTFASLQQNGYVISNPYIPFKIIFVPNERHQKLWLDDYNRSQDWVYQLKKIRNGEVVYNVWAIDDPATGCSQKIGSIVASSYAVTSAFADEYLFFRHDAWDKDLQMRPEWEAYSASRNPDPVEYKKTGQCPMSKPKQCFSLCRAEGIVCKANCGMLTMETASTQMTSINTKLIETDEHKEEQRSPSEDFFSLFELKSTTTQSENAICDLACQQEQCLNNCTIAEEQCELNIPKCRPRCQLKQEQCLDQCAVLTTNGQLQQCRQNCYDLNTICLAECTVKTDICSGICNSEDSYNGISTYQNQNTPFINFCRASELFCIAECRGITELPAAQNPAQCIATCKQFFGQSCINQAIQCPSNCTRLQNACVKACGNGNATCIQECSASFIACKATCNFGFDCQNNCQSITANINSYAQQSQQYNTYNTTSPYSVYSQIQQSMNPQSSGYSYASGYNARSYGTQQTICQRSCTSQRQTCYVLCYIQNQTNAVACINQCNTDFTECNRQCPLCASNCQTQYQACYADTSTGACGDTSLTNIERACACSLCQSFLTECNALCEAQTRLDCLGFNLLNSPILYTIRQLSPTPSCLYDTIQTISLTSAASQSEMSRAVSKYMARIGPNGATSTQKGFSVKSLNSIAKQQSNLVKFAKSKNAFVKQFFQTVIQKNPTSFQQRTVQVTQKAMITSQILNAKNIKRFQI